MKQRAGAKTVEQVLEEKSGDHLSRYPAGREREYQQIGIPLFV